MRIKNTELLVERARAHRHYDHIKQGTYGEAKLKPHFEFRGCAIGCLVVPANPSELLKFVEQRSLESPEGGYGWGFMETIISNGRMRTKLREEFGLCWELTFLAEVVFENTIPQRAKNFVVEFTEALNEGAWIGRSEVEAIEAKLNKWDVGDVRYIPALLEELGSYKGPVTEAVEPEQEVEVTPSLVLTGV